MNAAQTNPMQRLLLVVTFVLIFIMAARTPLDSDLWWHLRSGEQMLQSGRPLLVDEFSHTRHGEHWVNHSWLSQVGMALLHRWGGFLALGAAVSVLSVLSMVLVSLQCSGPAALKSLALILGSVVASVVWGPRPQLTSLVLLAGVGCLFHDYKYRRVNRLWLLPLVMMLWSNLHGGFALGFLLSGAVISGEILNHALKLPVENRLSWRELRQWVFWTALSAVTVLVNPNGLDVWRIPFQTVSVGVLQQFIAEWASPDFHQLVQQTVLWLLFAVVGSVALSGRVMDGVDLVVLVGFAWMALVARRNFGPFAVVAVPLLTRYLAAAVDSWQRRASWPGWALRLWRRDPSGAAVSGVFKAINLGLVGTLALVGFLKLYSVTHPALVQSYLALQAPARAAHWIASHPPQGRMLNEYNWGGYLLWALPDVPVFVDGRTDLYGDEVLGDWITMVQAGEGWQEIVARYEINWVVLQPDRPVLGRLAINGWVLVYADEQAVIYENPVR